MSQDENGIARALRSAHPPSGRSYIHDLPEKVSPMSPTMSSRHLSVLSYAQGYTHWHYHGLREGRELSAILQENFFSSHGDMMAAGDTIMVSAKDGAVLLYVESSAPFRAVVMAKTVA